MLPPTPLLPSVSGGGGQGCQLPQGPSVVELPNEVELGVPKPHQAALTDTHLSVTV